MVKITVVGGGCLGVKIIGELAFHGHEVRVLERNQERLDYVRLRIQEEKNLLTEDGILPPSGFIGEIFYMSRLEEAVKSSDFVIEAVPEDLALKQELFEWLSQSARSDAVIASSSMSLDIEEVIKNAAHKERCLGMRYLFPVYCIPEVEIVPSSFTSTETLQKVRSFLGRMGKVAFLRSGDEPLVLTAKQREAKKAEFLKKMREGDMSRAPHTIPDLEMTSSKGFECEDSSSACGRECVVCMSAERDCVLHPCHHLCACHACGRALFKRQDACPICRRPISSVFRVFHA